MKKNKVIIIGLLLILLIIGLIIFRVKSNNKAVAISNEVVNVESDYDETTGLYYVKNEQTGEIIGASPNKEDIQFYIDHPDYNPNPLVPRSKNLEDFVYMEEIENITE